MTTTIASRGSLGWAGAVLAGGLSAAAYALAFENAETMLIFIAYFGVLPLFMAGLGAGNGPVVLASLIGTAAVFLINHNILLTASYAVFYAVPAVFLSFMALRARRASDGKVFWYPEGYLLTAMTLYPCLIFLGLVAMYAGQEGGLLGQTEKLLQAAFAPMSEELGPDLADDFKAMLDLLPRVLPSVLGCSWVFLILMSMLAAHGMLKQQSWNLRPSFSWVKMTIPNWVIIAAAATGLAAAFAPPPYDYVGLTLCTLLCLPFFFTGLAVVHLYVALFKAKMVFLILFYAVLTIFPWAALLIALLGALDQLFHFRHRLPQRSDAQGEKK